MAHVHGNRSHYVRPGIDDPVYSKSGVRREHFGSDDEFFSTGGWRKIRKKTGKGKKAGRDKTSRGKAATKGKATERASLFVLGQDGTPLYLCGKNKARRAKAGIIATLPHDSYIVRGKTIQLIRDTQSLGFESAEEFTHWCMSLTANNGQHASNNDLRVGADVQYDSRNSRKHGKNSRTATPVASAARRVRTKKWHRVEDDALRHQFAIGEIEMHQIKKAIPYRTNADIRQRIQELGLNRVGEDDIVISTESLKAVWAQFMITYHYRIYGAQWDRWQLILPWLDADSIAELADDLGCGDLWSDEERESFLENEGGGWTLDELNLLIRVSPLIDDDNELWPAVLPRISSEERYEMREVLNIPDRDRIDKYARMAEMLG